MHSTLSFNGNNERNFEVEHVYIILSLLLVNSPILLSNLLISFSFLGQKGILMKTLYFSSSSYNHSGINGSFSVFTGSLNDVICDSTNLLGLLALRYFNPILSHSFSKSELIRFARLSSPLITLLLYCIGT